MMSLEKVPHKSWASFGNILVTILLHQAICCFETTAYKPKQLVQLGGTTTKGEGKAVDFKHIIVNSRLLFRRFVFEYNIGEWCHNTTDIEDNLRLKRRKNKHGMHFYYRK